MQKLKAYIRSGILISLFALTPNVYADGNYELTITNHFDSALSFVITINPMILADLSKEFSLQKSESVKTRVLDLNKEAYIRAFDQRNQSAFWGVEIQQNKVKVHGYLGKGIAYSWNTKEIVFCLPEEYKKYHSCIH